MATTQSLELINPYAKFGLKRRPTYEEIANLIGENEQLTGKLPNTDATFFKSSPQGSFFDGSDLLELLKDQQMRILDRQMREIMMKQEAHRNGHTYAVHRRKISNRHKQKNQQLHRCKQNCNNEHNKQHKDSKKHKNNIETL